MHRCVHSSALIGDREYSALECDGEARCRLEVAFELILLRLAPRIVGEAGKYGKTVGERREKRVSRCKIFSCERGPFVRPPSRRICPHIFDCGAHRIDICFWNAEPNELAVTVFETGFGAEIIGVAHIDSFQRLDIRLRWIFTPLSVWDTCQFRVGLNSGAFASYTTEKRATARFWIR